MKYEALVEKVNQYGDQCWELDAIEPNELITLCRAAVVSLIEDKAASH